MRARGWILGLWLCAWAGQAQAGSLRLGVAVQAHRELWGRSLRGLVFLEIPWERLGSPRLGEPTEDPEQDEPEQVPTPPSEAPTPPPVALPAPVRLPEPLVEGTLRAALRASGRALALARLRELSSRSRWSAVLPTLTLRAARATDESLRIQPTSDIYQATQTGSADLVLEARATWKLDRLVFADQEIAVERLRTERARAIDQLFAGVLKQLLAFQRATVLLTAPELSPEKRLKLMADALQAEVALDVLTDGYFGRELVLRKDRTSR